MMLEDWEVLDDDGTLARLHSSSSADRAELGSGLAPALRFEQQQRGVARAHRGQRDGSGGDRRVGVAREALEGGLREEEDLDGRVLQQLREEPHELGHFLADRVLAAVEDEQRRVEARHQIAQLLRRARRDVERAAEPRAHRLHRAQPLERRAEDTMREAVALAHVARRLEHER